MIMVKKKPKRNEPTRQNDDLESWSPPKQRRGRKSKVPGTLEACLADLTDHTEAWMRRFAAVWFDFTFRRIELAEGAGSHEESPEWYDYVINRMLDLADRVEEGIKVLKKGKATAKRRLPR
jgi:hypothetical protein